MQGRTEPTTKRVRELLAVAIGGALGAVARWGVGVLVARWGAHLPLGTWAVNAAGCFLLGLAVPFALRGEAVWLRAGVAVGFLGAFTTFSTFAVDGLALWEGGRGGWALANAVGSVVVGTALAALGLWLGRALAG
jgi:CrcB protein